MFKVVRRGLILLIGFSVLYIQWQQSQALAELHSVQSSNVAYLEGRINNVAADLSDFEHHTRARLDVLDARTRMNR